MGRKSRLVRTGLRRVCSAWIALACSWALAARADESAQALDAVHFFRYLTDCEHPPALVGFNPTAYDPRDVRVVTEADRESLRLDLQALAGVFNGLILYAYDDQWTPLILEAAWRQGFKAILLGVFDPKSDLELTGIAQAIRDYGDKMALAIVVGNEGLIGNRYRVEDVVAAADRLRAMTMDEGEIPLTTTEPIGEYGFEPLRRFGDFLAPNIHPALDQQTLDPVQSARWTRDRAQALARFAYKPVLVKETGFPNGGGLRYTEIAQKAFWDAYLSDGRLSRLADNSAVWISFAAGFEAFDMPWKADITGESSEGHWGFLGIDRRPYPVMDVWQTKASEGPLRSSREQGCL